MNNRFPITPEGYKKLSDEIHHLKTVDRIAIIAAIAEAREHGDLSENAEYSAAKEKQGFIEAKIADLESKLARAEVIDYTGLQVKQVQFGAEVTLLDHEANKNITYRIVGDYEADLSKGLISISSPLSRALMGKASGDEVEAYTPKGTRYYEIIKIIY